MRRTTPLLLALALAACPASDPRPEVSVPAPPEAARGGILRVAMAGDVGSLDPHTAATPSGWFFARALHRGLLAFPGQAPGTEPVPDLATAMPEVAAGARRFTFELREAAFPGGAALTATDVRASLARVRDAGVGVAGALSVIRSVRADGPSRVVIRTRRAAPDLPWVLAHPQVAILRAGAPAPGARFPTSIQGLGPYRLATYRPQRSIVLARSPSWGDDPVRGAFIDGIEARIGVTAARASEAIDEGITDLVLDPGPPDVAPAPDLARGAVSYSVARCVRYLFLNTTVAPFGDRDVRRAVAHAIDRVPLAAREGTVAAGGLLPPAVLGHHPEPVLEPGPERARVALARGGRPRGFATRLVVADALRDRREARIVARSLARAGIEVSVRRVAPATLYQRHYRRDAAAVPMGIATWCADWPGLAGRNVLGAIAAPGGLNLARLRAPAIGEAIADAARAPQDRGAGAWAAADASIQRTGALIALTYPAEPVVTARRVRGVSGAAMWPSADPTALWLDPAAPPGA